MRKRTILDRILFTVILTMILASMLLLAGSITTTVGLVSSEPKTAEIGKTLIIAALIAWVTPMLLWTAIDKLCGAETPPETENQP